MSIGELSKKAALAATSYLRRHPEEMLRAAKNATSLKIGVPLAALRWLAKELAGKKLPPDFRLEARSPGLFVSGSLELMKTPLKASTTVLVERVDMSQDKVLVDIRLTNLALEVTDPTSGTPISALLQSGALDLSGSGDLLSYMPKRPEIIVDAKGDRFTLDLMKHPKLSKDGAKRVVALLVPLLGIDAIQTEDEHLAVEFLTLPRGAADAINQLKRVIYG